jgi:uncharacterized surface protein with fasciclin (FAS1) repeats
MRAIPLIRAISILLVAGIAGITACKKSMEETGFFDENVVSITTFLENNKEEYSRYWQVVQTTGLYHTLNAFNPLGAGYTLFLPTDAAFDRYIQVNDKYPSFESLLNDLEFAWLLGRYHLVNSSLLTYDFPYGALPDSNATGDYLTIGIEILEDSSLYKVNNAARLVAYDIETSNGTIHIIDEVLEPITFNSFQLLVNREGYSILSRAFELTGLKDTMDIFIHDRSGHLIRNEYTVLAEHDSIYQRQGILSFDDLVEKYHTPGRELDDPEGGLYQFTAYHMLKRRWFLDDFADRIIYNSYAVYPLDIDATGLDIKINPGVDSFGVVISGTDTMLIDYIGLFYQESNVNTKNGPIHFITEIMEPHQPRHSNWVFEFLENRLIEEYSSIPGLHEIVDPDLLEMIWWEGPEKLDYVKESEDDNNAMNGDYIELNGNFKIEYTMPEVLPGRYQVVLNTDANGQDNATIQVRIDGKRVGGNINLTIGGNDNNPFHQFNIGIMEFTRYEEHLIRINSLIPGNMKWDYVKFEPEN